MTNSVSSALLARTTIVTNKRNPANIGSHKNGTQGSYYTSRIPVNLGNSYNGVCNLNTNNGSNTPQPTVTNTSSLLKRRTSSCTSGSSGSNCGNTNFKLQNPLNFTASAYINRQSIKASQCEINPNSAYEDFKQQTFTRTINGVTEEVCCARPIVKVTNTPSTSTFLRTQYFKNNCVPPPTAPKPGSISTTKIMLNKNCGNSNGC